MQSHNFAVALFAVVFFTGCAGTQPDPEHAHSTAASSGSSADTQPNETLPQAPSRTSVFDSMRAISPAVQRCLEGYPGGEIAVRLTFDGSGAVTSATVDAPRPSQGPDDGARSNVVLDDEARTCVEAALRTATLPPFRQASIGVSFPFRGP
jgi:hypothetical protein